MKTKSLPYQKPDTEEELMNAKSVFFYKYNPGKLLEIVISKILSAAIKINYDSFLSRIMTLSFDRYTEIVPFL
jgi:hypothetical protein